MFSSHALKQFFPGEIQGAINVAWTIEKFKHIKREKSNKTWAQDVQNIWSKSLWIQRKLLKKNSKQMEAAHNSVEQFQEKLSSARYESESEAKQHHKLIPSRKICIN